ncbi:lytic transglycosylase domain-containing protein [Sphingomonas sp. Root710]|uniref:lytic transglycosylase domain-containing protein n=1 Tax=Sphingomonas sp. Root710 TaxID=1736594 RepID=UPI000AA06B05|nr:lytic transglycosylase domain-containing protein [Sphingomonas sp. Root710]
MLVSTAAIAATVAPEIPSPSALKSPVAAAPAWREDVLQGVIAEWRRLQQSDSLPFKDYAAFLIAHPGWPGESAMRRAAERRIDPNNYDPALVVRFFTGFAPLTAAGQARYAEALAATGRTAEARSNAAGAWTTRGLSTDDEARLMARFGSTMTRADHDRRMERLLLDRATTPAARQIANVSPSKQALFAARLALLRNDADVDARIAAAGDAVNHDPGYMIERARYLRDRGDSVGARIWLGKSRDLTSPPFDTAYFLDNLLSFAQAANADGQYDMALAIAKHAEQAFPPGTRVRDRPFAERDDYTSLVWLAGRVALDKLARYDDAMAMFDRYARAAQTPGTQTKGWYWAARAAERGGKPDWAQSYLAQAAPHIDQYYGQLAAERLGRDLVLPPEPARGAVSATERAAFEASEVVRAARLLGRTGSWQDQTAFIRLIAANAKTDSDHILAGELAKSIDRPDLGVMVSRAARTSGTPDPLRIGFPEVPVPPAMASHWTLIHAISRQESQFDRQATSRTGARGLMQLMPATAREQAGKLGLDHDPAKLTDIGYNVMLGSAFFDRMLTYYGGNYVLAIASYNAGPGNVNKFIRANGDPRLPGVDVVEWVEAIPFTETRGYVQKVLENAVVYDMLNPAKARGVTRNRLSSYLGKVKPG